MKTRLIVATALILGAIAVLFTPQTPDEPKRQAVFGRTMCPTWPYCGTWDGHVAVIHRSDPWVL